MKRKMAIGALGVIIGATMSIGGSQFAVFHDMKKSGKFGVDHDMIVTELAVYHDL